MSQTSDHVARSAGDAVACRTSNWVMCALLASAFVPGHGTVSLILYGKKFPAEKPLPKVSFT